MRSSIHPPKRAVAHGAGLGAALGIVLWLVSTVALAQPGPASTQVLQAVAAEFQAKLEDTARSLDSDPQLRGLSTQQRISLLEFVFANMSFVLSHEMGHALIGEMELPVLGREEDAADAHAVLIMLKINTSFTHRVLVDAAKGWFVSDERRRAKGEKLVFYDEHGLDRQRAYQIVCLMVGSNPDQFKDLADDTKLPESRRKSCKNDYDNASWSWDTALKPHLRAPEGTKTRIDVVYGTGSGALDVYAQLFRKMRFLEAIADSTSDLYAWPRPLTLEMQTCGYPDARWYGTTQKLRLCYELAAEFGRLYRDSLARPPFGRKGSRTARSATRHDRGAARNSKAWRRPHAN